MSTPLEIDPELLQAIVDLRKVFADYRRAKQQVLELKPTSQSRARAAAGEFMGDNRSIIRTRAERIAVDPDVLVVLLGVDADETKRLRKRPNKHQMEKAIRAAISAATDRAAAAKVASDAAQAELAAAERQRVATRAACLAYTGYGA